MNPLERVTGDPDGPPNAASRLLNFIALGDHGDPQPTGWVVRIRDPHPDSSEDKVHGPFADPREANAYRDALESDLHRVGFTEVELTVLPMYDIDATVKT